MDKDKVVAWLTDMCQDYAWFHSVGFDKYGRAVVYVHYMDGDVLRFVPDWTDDRKQVLLHFASSAPDAKNEFVSKPQEKPYSPYNAPHGETVILSAADAKAIGLTSLGFVETARTDTPQGFGQLVDTEEQERQLELSVRALTDELDRIERSCGSNVLQDIFYEVHDGTNAVTNLSARYPEVRQRVQKLYDKYGFDTIYEELDG
jgi:hypothetical protein